MHGSFAQAHDDYLDPDNNAYEPDYDAMADLSFDTVSLITETVGELNPRRFYEKFYKEGNGVSIGFQLNDQWVWNEDLPETIQWVSSVDDIDTKAGKIVAIIGVHVAGIVEGSDAEIEGGKLGPNFSIEDFHELLQNVENQIATMWEAVNG